MFTALNKILPFAIKKLGLGQVLELNEICEKWDDGLCQLFGQAYKNKTKPLSLKDKVLTVDCLNSNWACELSLKQDLVIGQINKIIKKTGVEKIRFIS